MTSYAYLPANYFPVPGSTGLTALTVFPRVGKSIEIPMPFQLGAATFSADGKSIYGTGFDPAIPGKKMRGGLAKVEFNPMRVSVVPGTEEFNVVSAAVSYRQDNVLLSGFRDENGQRNCGLFEVTQPSGKVRQIFRAPNCGWYELSLSPNGQRAVARRELHFQVIDLVHGNATPLGEQIVYATWSPNGKWIAAAENSGNNLKLFLLDPDNPSHRRRLASNSAGLWSPDSRYVLVIKDELRCGFLYPFQTFHIIDVANGSRQTVGNSHCKIVGGASGWVSKEILQDKSARGSSIQ